MNDPTHIYVSGPMRGRDGFNFPAFFAAEAVLRSIWPEAHICNPAREDVERFGLGDLLFKDETGLLAGRYLMDQAGFGETELRQALGGDLAYICTHANMIVMLPGWEDSSGATAELATAKALQSVTIGHFNPEGASSGAIVLSDGTVVAGGSKSRSEALKGSVDQSPTENLKARQDRHDAALAAQNGFEVHGGNGGSGGILGEVRATSKTGGQKGVKLAAFDQINPGVLWELAEHFGRGARKYQAHNFRRGYPWSQSFSALCRHLWEFWGGKEWDVCDEHCERPEPRGESEHGPTCYNHTGSRVIIAVIWHAMALAEFSRYPQFKEYDDRYVYDQDH